LIKGAVIELFGVVLESFANRATRALHLTALWALMAFVSPQFTFADGGNMQVFDTIESIEFSALARKKEARQSESFVEIVPINQNTFLSAEWTMKKIAEFYSQDSGSCKSYEEKTITCSRDVYTVDGKFRVIISFQESLGLIPVIEHVAIGVK
jgi:hypothetical protein